MLRKIFAVLLGTLAVSAAIYASGCNEAQFDAFACSETSAAADNNASVTLVSQAAITRSSHTDNSIRIYWDKTVGANGYDILRQDPSDIKKWDTIARITDDGANVCTIYRYNASTKKFEKAESVSKKADFSYRDDTGLSSGAVYTYKLKAFSNIGGKIIYGPESVPFSAATSPPAPEVTDFTHTGDEVQIYWNKTDCANGYEIFRYNTSTKKWDKIKTIDGNSTFSYSEGGLSSGAVYKYKVRAYIKFAGVITHGNSSAEFAAATDPEETNIVNYVQNINTLTLYWEKVQCSGYYIQQYKNGEWETVTTVASPNEESASLTGLEANKKLDFRIVPFAQASSTVVEGKASETYSLVLEYMVVAKSGSVIKDSPAWSSNTIMGYNKGTVFHVLETSGNWFKVEYNDTVGYIYNKAVTGKANYSSITTDTLPVAADDWLFDHGTSISAIFNYVKEMRYTTTPKMSIEQMAVKAFRLRTGACYYYASLMYYLLDRAGYEVYIVQGESRPHNEHWWNLVRTSEGWRHYDATPFRDHDYLYGATDEEAAGYMTKWDRSRYPAAN